MARPRKPLELHLIKNTYRRDRHGDLPGTPLKPAPTPPEPEPSPLDAELAQWSGFLAWGTDFFQMLPPGVTEKQAHRRARGMWRRLGKRFMATWPPDSDPDWRPWALEKFGPPNRLNATVMGGKTRTARHLWGRTGRQLLPALTAVPLVTGAEDAKAAVEAERKRNPGFTQAAVTRAVKGVKATGAAVGKVEITKDKITVEIGTEAEIEKTADVLPLDAWRARHAR